jgi:glycosyltransferase involved in cell wall biosynthesis
VIVTPQPDPDCVLDSGLLEGLPVDLTVYRTPAPNLLRWSSRAWSLVRETFQPRGRQRNPSVKSSGTRKGNAEAHGWLDWASLWLQVPDQGIGWLPSGAWSACRAVQRHRCRAIYSSAPLWTAHIISLLVKRLTGLPWVAGFRDPWRGNPFRQFPYRSVDRYDDWLEQRVVREADWVIANTEPARAQFAARYPHLAAKFVAIPNGFDPEEFANLQPRRESGPEGIVVTHAGCFYGPRRPHGIFQALSICRQQTTRPVRLELLGLSTYDGTPLAQIAAEYQVSDSVRIAGEVPHRVALEYLRGSDIQLLVGFGGPGSELQVPAKFFEYLGVGRPILALAPPGTAIAEMMNQSRVAGAVCDPDDPRQIAEAVLKIVANAKPNDLLGPGVNGSSTYYAFHRREQVGCLAKLLAARRPDGAL